MLPGQERRKHGAAPALCYRFIMASPNGPNLRSAVPSTRLAIPIGSTTDISQGMLPQEPSNLSERLSSGLGERAVKPATAAETAGGPPPERIPRWLARLELFLRVMLRMYIGLAVCYAPWSHTFWDQNPIFLQFPTLSIIAANGAVRGLVSGLGLLNLWIALHDAMGHGDR